MLDDREALQWPSILKRLGQQPLDRPRRQAAGKGGGGEGGGRKKKKFENERTQFVFWYILPLKGGPRVKIEVYINGPGPGKTGQGKEGAMPGQKGPPKQPKAQTKKGPVVAKQGDGARCRVLGIGCPPKPTGPYEPIFPRPWETPVCCEGNYCFGRRTTAAPGVPPNPYGPEDVCPPGYGTAPSPTAM